MDEGLKRYALYIDGAWREPDRDSRIESYNPATGRPWALFADAAAGQVDAAVNAAHLAFTTGAWPKMSAADRARALRRLADLLPPAVEKLAYTETVDCGKIIKETRAFGAFCQSYYAFYADIADKLHGETYTPPQGNLHVHTIHEPLGVVAAIVPWNNQLWLLSLKLGPALAAGNTVVIKPSEVSAAPTLEFARLIEQLDLPKGVVNVVTGGPESCGRVLTAHPHVSRIAFTGGPETARHIVRNSAENLASISLELGGKSPVIVFPDADLDNAVASICAGVFVGSSGQSCVAGSRVYVHEAIYDRFVADLIAKVKSLRVGDPLDEQTQMGPLATSKQLSRIQAEVGKATEQGAALLCGGRKIGNEGWYFEPTILECRDQKLPIVDTELFGPVLCVLRFKDEDEVVALANDTKYGLAAGIFTRDLGRTIRLTRAIRAGIQYVNCYRLATPMTEIGGFKNSGFSREGGMQSLLDYTRPKTVWINSLI